MARQGKRIDARRCVAAAVLAVAGTDAAALSFESESGFTLDLDTTLTWGAQWRVEGARAGQLRRLPAQWDDWAFARRFAYLSDPQTVIAQNMDDGNNNFDKGLISNRATALVELELERDGYGVFLRGKAFYDQVYRDRDTDMDAVGYRTMNDAPGVARGDFIERTRDEHGAKAELLDAYVYGGFDIGERLLDLRVGRQVINWGEATFFSGINGMQNWYDAAVANVPGTEVKEIYMPTGAVYAQIDLSSAVALQGYYQYEWKPTRLNAVGSYFSQQDFLGPGAAHFYLGVLDLFGLDPRLPRLPDDEPGEQGQWGVALRYALESGAELGFYYLNAHNKAPSFQRNGVPLPTDFRLLYFDDIRVVGASFSTILGDTQVNGEVSYRDGLPMTVTSGNPERQEVMQGQIGFTQVFQPRALWDDLSVVGEFVAVDVLNRSNNEMSGDARGVAYALRAEFAYKNVMEALDVSVPVFVQHTLDGTVREANLVEDAVTFSIGLRGTWSNVVIAEITYANYFGGGFDNWLTDRDNIAFNVKYSF